MSRRPEHNAAQSPTTEPTRWVRARGAVWRASLDRVIVSAPGSQRLITLTGAAAEVWFALAEPVTVDALSAALEEIYSDTSDTISADLRSSLHELTDQGAVLALA